MRPGLSELSFAVTGQTSPASQKVTVTNSNSATTLAKVTASVGGSPAWLTVTVEINGTAWINVTSPEAGATIARKSVMGPGDVNLSNQRLPHGVYVIKAVVGSHRYTARTIVMQ